MTETEAAVTNDQATVWNGAGSQGWVAMEGLIDRVFAPFEQALVAAVEEAVDEATATRSAHVLDVGCGSGATTVAIARHLGKRTRCTGIDVAAGMITAARDRADREQVRATFVEADAQHHRFDPGSVDVVASRWGVMFFADSIAAFANLRTATRSGGELRAITWRSPEENPFMTTAERAAAPLLDLPTRSAGEPGQFGLADPSQIDQILDRSGWRDVELTPIDHTCAFPATALDAYLTNLGPFGRAIRGMDEGPRTEILATVRPAFDAYIEADQVRFDAACWMISAQA